MKNRVDGDAGEILADIKLGGIEYPGTSLTTEFVLDSVTMPEELTPSNIYSGKLKTMQKLLKVSDEIVKKWNHGAVNKTIDNCLELLNPTSELRGDEKGEPINPPL